MLWQSVIKRPAIGVIGPAEGSEDGRVADTLILGENTASCEINAPGVFNCLFLVQTTTLSC
jgi:hypothetical protein